MRHVRHLVSRHNSIDNGRTFDLECLVDRSLHLAGSRRLEAVAAASARKQRKIRIGKFDALLVCGQTYRFGFERGSLWCTAVRNSHISMLKPASPRFLTEGVSVSPDDGTSARRALEAGAEAVIIPMVRSAADVRGIIDALKFPPEGKRGLCPGLRVPGYSVTEFEPYMRENNANLYVIPMIETVEGLEHVDEICAIEQVKALVFASGELSFAMGEGAAATKVPRFRMPIARSAPRRSSTMWR